MTKAALVNASGADFILPSATKTMLKSRKTVISVCAVRTGCGKSQTTRKIAKIIKNAGKRVVIVRHPMPYGDLKKQAVQRFERIEDLDKNNCTIEEREEYEQHIKSGIVVYAGVDYKRILRRAEKEADIIIWDGGNNDTPFFKPDLHIVVLDALRPGHELLYYPGQTNFRMADVLIINKENVASKQSIEEIMQNIKMYNPNATLVHADSVIECGLDKKSIKGKKAVIVEDGPTLTHGGMRFGAGYMFAKKYGARITNVKKHAVGSIRDTFKKYYQLNGDVLPAMGYSKKQIKELEKTIKNANPDIVISGTPIDLNLVLNISIPIAYIRYSLKEKNIKLEKIIKDAGII